MSGIHRFLSKRDKHGPGKHHTRDHRDKVHTPGSASSSMVSRLSESFSSFGRSRSMRLSCCVSRTSSLSSTSSTGPLPVLVGAESEESVASPTEETTDIVPCQTITTIAEHNSAPTEDKFPGFFSADSPPDKDEELKASLLVVESYETALTLT